MEIMANPDYWREKKGVVGGVQWMSPTQYIQACEMGFRRSGSQGLVRQGRSEKLIKQYASDMQRGDKFPMLELDYRKDYFGQEGLHRAMAAEIINVKKVPVFIMKDAPSQLGEDDELGADIKPKPIKLRGAEAQKKEKEAKLKKFMDTFHKVTQEHPFDPSSRIAWDGKSMADVKPMWGDIYIQAIQTLAPGERSGSANGLIMTLVKIAQETGVTLRLDADPFGTTDGKLTKRQLIAWYKRRGFVVDHGNAMIFDPS